MVEEKEIPCTSFRLCWKRDPPSKVTPELLFVRSSGAAKYEIIFDKSFVLSLLYGYQTGFPLLVASLEINSPEITENVNFSS